MRLLALFTLLASTLSSPLFAAAVPAALLPPPTELISRQPIQWDIPRAISVDVTCDGTPDTLVIGYQGPHQFWLHLQPGDDVEEWGESIHFALTPAPAEGATLCQVPIQIQPATRACRSGRQWDVAPCPAARASSSATASAASCTSTGIHNSSGSTTGASENTAGAITLRG